MDQIHYAYGTLLGLYFLTITQALCPPNPKVLLSAALTVLGWDL